MRNKQGFSMVEMLVVIGILAVMAGIVFVSIDPKSRLGQAHELQRQSDLEKILAGANAYAIEHDGSFPAVITTQAKIIGTASTGCLVPCAGEAVVDSCLNLGNTLIPDYLQKIPFDPITGSAEITYYSIKRINNASGLPGLELRACSTEPGKDIVVRQ